MDQKINFINNDSFDIVHISYDEPNAEINFNNIKNFFPNVLKIHGIKGFDCAHRAAANLSNKDWIFVIDGDCDVKTSFFDDLYEFDQNILPLLKQYENTVLSWSSKNSVNGLIYGNGGIKLWPRKLLSSVSSHENGQLDWIGNIDYLQMNNWYGYTVINFSPYQAWRAGFREAVKFCTKNTKPIKNPKIEIHEQNYVRLLVWLTIGIDVPNGSYAIMGARMGSWLALCGDIDPQIITDYDSLKNLWNNNLFLCQEGEKSKYYFENALKLRKYFGLDIVEFSSEQSKWFKTVYKNPKREGLLKKWTNQTI